MSAAAAKAGLIFFTADAFAVAGASTDRAKFGNKVLRWLVVVHSLLRAYQARSLPVTPINPNEKLVEGLSTISSIADLPASALPSTSLSIITPPRVSLSILQEAFSSPSASVRAAWLQPGAEDESVKAWVREQGLGDRVVLGGPCVLVSGDEARAQAAKL